MVGTLSALEANGAEEELVAMCRDEVSEVLQAESPRHTHPYSRVPVASVFSTRTFRGNRAVS